MKRIAVLTALLSLPLGYLHAQDTTPADRGVRIGITYTPGLRPGVLVLGGPHEEQLDTVRTILQRDLDYSDRFEVVHPPGSDSLTIGIESRASTPTTRTGTASADGTYVNYPLYAALGADLAVNVFRNDAGIGITVYDVKGENIKRQIALPGSLTDPEFRMQVHRASDEVVRLGSGSPGIAATRLAFLQKDRIYRIDSDGGAMTAVSPAGTRVFSPAWQPDGRRLAYTEFGAGNDRLVVMNTSSNERRIVTPTTKGQNWMPAFSPDGNTLAFARTTDEGTDIFTYNLASDCCLQRLTIGRFSDNLSPTYSPDSRRITFVSTRSGSPQIYVMASDGTGLELFAPFDYGVTGNSNAPDWSPDGLSVAFHREVGSIPQIFVMDVASRRVRQLTSAGRNEDPTWAPDGRHLTYVSDRTGSRQLWVIDLDTGRVRQLTRTGEARLPAWSPRIGQQ
jgi:TolB protein